jgi:hypothetical protein
MRTIEQAKYWIDEQRAQLGNPRITSVQAYLGDSMETVSVYAEVENQVEINGDLPLARLCTRPARLPHRPKSGRFIPFAPIACVRMTRRDASRI